jgi:hypothetical protein
MTTGDGATNEVVSKRQPAMECARVGARATRRAARLWWEAVPNLDHFSLKSYDFIHLPSQNGNCRKLAPGPARATL